MINIIGTSFFSILIYWNQLAVPSHCYRNADNSEILYDNIFSSQPLVMTDKGLVRGKQMFSRSGRRYFAFTSIPYAQPPIDDLRFERPVEPNSWDGIYEGPDTLPDCWQVQALNPLLSNLTYGQEDCLYLSVFTPKVISTSRLPVMVYIPGGAYRSEFPPIGPSIRSRYLLDHDVVLVTFKYRLGAFGFLSLENPELPGNMGLKDSAMVLHWVNKNIHNFGGDPNSVTIFGNSVGGVTVHHLIISPMTKHLFHRGIMQSGAATNLWGLSAPGVQKYRALTIAEHLQCPTSPYSEMISCLKQRPAFAIADSDRLFIRRDFDPICPFLPIIDSGPDSIVPVSPYQAIIDKPIIIGNTRDEGAFKTLWYLLYPQLIETFSPDILPEALSYTNSTTQLRDISNALINKYKYFTELWTKSLFFQGTVEALKRTSGPVYQYLFAHRGLITSIDAAVSQTSLNGTIPPLGISHTEEMYYLFDFQSEFNIPAGPDDVEISKTLVKLWTNFAKYGKPTLDDTWPVYDKVFKKYLHIDDTFRVDENLWADDVQFLSSLPFRDKLERLGL